MAPLIRLGIENEDASEVFVDGDQIVLSFGRERRRFRYADFPTLAPEDVRAAAKSAAVFGDVEFGSQPPATPLLSVKIPPDLRVSYVGPPAADRWHAAIRFLRTRCLTLDRYIEQGIMTEQQCAEIRSLVRERKNLVISGGTSSGKTTLLRAILGEIPHDERLLILEDTPELAIPGENVAHLYTCPGVDLAALLRQTLRMTPDRITLGEVRGPEALELVTAMNTGHDGTLCTLHSNGARRALTRLHTQCRKLQPHFPFEEIEEAVDAVIQIAGQGPERRVSEIWQVRR
jgi:type IV secretion system protein VirB11